MTREEIQAAILHEGYKDHERLEAIGELIKERITIPKVYWIVACRWLYKKFVSNIPLKSEEYVDGEEDWEE